MFDRWEYTITANTSEALRKKVECKISPGTLTDLVVYFPPGCHGMVKCRVFLGEKPVAPRSAARYLAADGFAIELHNINELISENLPVLTWEIWSPDTAYPHALWMSAEWISAEESYEKQTVSILKEFTKTLRRLIGF